jgi:lipoprotein-anchoring transpeptidase ErfK/SrfK
MIRRAVWLTTLTLAGVFLAGSAFAQYRGYGDSYDGAPNYYEGGPPGAGPYSPPAYGPDADPDAAPPQRAPRQGYEYNGGPEERDYGYQPDYEPPRGGRMPYADPTNRSDAYGPGAPDGGDPNDPGAGNGPAHKANDYDLGESANLTTRTEVENTTRQPPGTIVIDTATRHLYLTQGEGRALQYGIGVGRQGFAWKGVAQVKRKSEWPDWIPPSDMLKRRPDLPARMAGGMENPLGARALYLFQGNKDTLFRIHGTNEPDTIGKAVSSGCIRMMNADVIDLYKRVPIGTKVVVL